MKAWNRRSSCKISQRRQRNAHLRTYSVAGRQQVSVVEQSKYGLEQKIESAKTERDAQRLACRRVQQQQRACHSEMGSLETERQQSCRNLRQILESKSNPKLSLLLSQACIHVIDDFYERVSLLRQVSEAEQKKKTVEQKLGREQAAQAALQGRRAALQREIKRLEQQDANALEASKQLNAEVIKLEEAKKALHRRLQAASTEMAAKRHNLLSESQQLSPLSAGSERVFSFTPSSRTARSETSMAWGPWGPCGLAFLGFGCWARRKARARRIPRVLRQADKVIRGGSYTLADLARKVKATPVKPDGTELSAGEVRHMEVRQKQIAALNNFMLQKHRKSRKKGIAPQILYTDEPDNPWRDRYLLCEDCEKRVNLGKEPRSNCNNSTLLELDMTAPFSRDNVMVTSCDLVQMIRDDVWVYKDKYGKLTRSDKKNATGTFPVQVCCVCRKTTLEEGRRFRMCNVCRGVSYCCERCRAAHNLKHQATCVRPYLPYRGEWGIRKELRNMRSEIYPLINTWALKEPNQHRIAWLPPPEHQQKSLDERRPKKKVSLPTGSRNRKLLAAEGIARSCVQDGKIVLRGRSPLAYRRQRTFAKQEVPGQEFLDMIGMTGEEYVQKDLELQKEVQEEDDASLSIVDEVVEEPAENLTLKNGTFGGKKVRPRTTLRGDHIPIPVREVPKVVLDEGAIARMEAAVESGEIVNIDEKQFAPSKPVWEMPRQGQARKFWIPVPEDKKKEGVVYPESPVRELAKKHGLRLSEDALKRLEAAAEGAEHNRHRISWQKPLIVDDAQEDDALLTGSMEASRSPVCEAGAADAVAGDTEGRCSVSGAGRMVDSLEGRTESLKESEERGGGGAGGHGVGSRGSRGSGGSGSGFLSECAAEAEAEDAELGNSDALAELGLDLSLEAADPEDLLGAGEVQRRARTERPIQAHQ
ncbi:unnamed protein product, partial [Symbiodinium necroappetens]